MEAPTGIEDPASASSTTSVARDRVAALHSSPDRIVFTEEDNTDGWIATDLTVEPRR